MRHIVFTALLFITAAPLFSQEDCDVFNIQELSAAYLGFQVDTIILQPDGSYEVQLSNGTTFIQVLGCTDQDYLEYDAAANTEDGSCATLVVNGCMDQAYVEYDATANTDDGSCATLTCANAGPTMDGYSYSTVLIGDQCWFSENLRTTVYADDSAIPEETDNSSWGSLSTDARCDYDNEAANVATYGRLYNWYAASDVAGLCPSGWHVPTDGEWTELENYISSQGFSGTEGTALKSTAGWSGGNGTDNFGFSALPGGYRTGSNGLFAGAGSLGNWWSSSPSGGYGWARYLNGSTPAIYRNYYNPRNGFSVRCLRGNVILGCMDADADNYDATANTDDGSCIFYGCMDQDYVEYDATANTDDGSCATLTCANAGPTMDGYSYSTVLIGYQCWFSENLRTTVYADDSAIPEETDNGTWTGLNTGARCDYYNDVTNVATYGRLYNLYAVDDAAGLCPSGWHVPTDSEWTDLEFYLSLNGHSGTEGTALKASLGWGGSGNGTDDFGFSALPGGGRSYTNGYFYHAGIFGGWWSSSSSGSNAWPRDLGSYDPGIARLDYNPRDGFSVRCLRDAD